MKQLVFMIVFLTLSLGNSPLLADSPISASKNWELTPAVAYNAVDEEYLVVWSEITDVPPFFGPVRGQLIAKNGLKIGDPFIIVSPGGVRPSVAYNPDRNEYCVVAEALLNTEIRILTAEGKIQTSMLPNKISGFTYPQVLYNTIDKTYLLVGIAIEALTPGSDQCHRSLRATRFVPSIGLGLIDPFQQILELTDDQCISGVDFAIDFAPISKPKTPKGRYLIALQRSPSSLKMLDHQGKPVVTKFDYQSGATYDSVPFQQSKVGQAHSVDVCFGHWDNEPVFLVVWSDSDARVEVPDGVTWDAGIVGGIVNAETDTYDASAEVANVTFPISWIYWHNTSESDVDSWLPRAVYSPVTKSFVVAWRETPTDHPLNNAIVNHIRAVGIGGYQIPPPGNIVLSLPIEAANPISPAIATSSSNTLSLAVWQDHRGFASTGVDLYGTLFDSQKGALGGIFSDSILFPVKSKNGNIVIIYME